MATEKIPMAALLKERFEKRFMIEGTDGVTLTPSLLLRGAGSALLAFVLGSAPCAFSCYPLGIAFLAATDRFAVCSLLGTVVAALFYPGYAAAAAAVYMVMMMLRAAVCRLTAVPAEPKGPMGPAGGGKRRVAGGWSFPGKRETGDAGPEKQRLPGRGEPTGGRQSAHSAGAGARGAPENAAVGNRRLRAVPMFGESILARCAVSALGAFLFGLYRLIEGGFLYYDLFGLILGFALCPLLTLGLSALFAGKGKLTRYMEYSLILLTLMTITALRGHYVWGFSLSFAAAVLTTLWAASGGGAAKGCIWGLLAGFAAGMFGDAFENVIPCLTAAMGLCAGVLCRLSKTAGVAGSCTLGIMMGVSAGGFGVMPRLIPDLAGAAAVFLPLSYWDVLPKIPSFVRPRDHAKEEAVILEKKQKDTVLRMNALSEAFARLSDVIYTLSDRLRRPGIVDLKQICDDAFERYCSRCSLAPLCFEKECTSTLDAQSKLTTALYTAGRIERSDVPDHLLDRCGNIDKIIASVNLGTAELIERLIKDDRTEAFAVDYESLSKLLAESVTENDSEYRIDEELTKKLRRSLPYLDLPSAGALVFGKRQKQVMIGGVELTGVHMSGEELRRSVENLTGSYLGMPRYSIEDDKVVISFTARRRFRVESAQMSSVKESENANGDTAAVFDGRGERSYALISDGMGSGREAAITSKLCSVFLEQMLSAGNSKAVTLGMLNGFIRSRGCECSATIDLAEIDLITGEACFVKSGAAPSFVLRGGNLYKLQSKTVPIGIMTSLDAEQIRFELTDGDVILLMSDGVASSLEDGVWLADLLTSEWEDSLERMAEKIVDNAVLNNKRSDDMTAVLLRITAEAIA